MIGFIFLVTAAFLFYYKKSSFEILAYVGVAFCIAGIALPILIKPFYLLWMTFAVVLGWIMTRIILSILFFSVVSFISIITKVLGKDFLGLKNSDNDSYWNFRNESQELNQDYEKQF